MWQVTNMDLGDIVSFIVGGFVSAVIFYPPKKKRINPDYMASCFAYWWFSGIYYAQKNKELLHITEEDILNWSTRPETLERFNESANSVVNRIES